MGKVKIAIIGAGKRGMYTYAPCILKSSNLCEIVAVVEPKKGRRDLFVQKYNIEDRYIFEDVVEFFEYEKVADAVIICTNDYKHYEIAKIALEKGYHVLLEKPMSNRLDGLIHLRDLYSRYQNRVFMICNTLRYAPFFKELKHIIDEKRLGELISIGYDDNISYWDFAHSFVRGSWRNSSDTSQLSLSKGCSDIDIILYLAHSNCKKITSFASLKHFSKENFKDEMAENCLDCKVEPGCPYSAKKIYLEKNLDINNAVHLNPTKENLLDILRKGPYGKCVYKCDNDVYDNMNSILYFENGVTSTLNINGFNKNNDILVKLKFSQGELIGSFNENKIITREFVSEKETIINPSTAEDVVKEANKNIIDEFIKNILNNKYPELANSIESHIIAFAAEYSIVSDESIYIDDFLKSSIEITKEIDKLIR